MQQNNNNFSIKDDGTIIRDDEYKENGGSKNTGWIVFLVFVFLISLILLGDKINQTRELKEEIYQKSLTINQMRSDVKRLTSHFYYGSWESSNNQSNSRSTKVFNLALDYGDVLDIYYQVSSEESYDIMTITLFSPNGSSEILCKESGQITNNIKTTVNLSGVYLLQCEYKKDGSINKYNDMVKIGVTVEKSIIKKLQNQ